MTTAGLTGRRPAHPFGEAPSCLSLVLLASLACSPAADHVPPTEAGVDGSNGRIDVASAPQAEVGIDGTNGRTDAGSAPQAEAGIDAAYGGTDADSAPQEEAGIDGIADAGDGDLPCTVSTPAKDIGPGAQGEYRVSLATPIFVAAGDDGPRFLATGSGASEIVYFDGGDFVDRLLVPSLERRTPANLSGMPGVPARTSSEMSNLYIYVADLGVEGPLRASTVGRRIPGDRRGH